MNAVDADVRSAEREASVRSGARGQRQRRGSGLPLLVSLVGASCLLLGPAAAFAYSQPTHTKISEAALQVFARHVGVVRPSYSRAFLKGSVEPDAQEVSNKFMYWHLVNPFWFEDGFSQYASLASGTNCDRPTDEPPCSHWGTARRRPHFGWRLERYLDAFRAHIRRGEHVQAWRAGGAIAHYLQDVTVPSHALPIFHLGEDTFDNLRDNGHCPPPFADPGEASATDAIEQLERECKGAEPKLPCTVRVLVVNRARDTRNRVIDQEWTRAYWRPPGDDACEFDGDPTERPSGACAAPLPPWWRFFVRPRRKSGGFGCVGPKAFFAPGHCECTDPRGLALFDELHEAAVERTLVLLHLLRRFGLPTQP